MLKFTNLLLTLRYLLIGLLTSIGMTACIDEPKIKRPPVIIPINLANAGVIADFQFEVRKHLVYWYSLRFNFPEDDQIERTRVRNILDGYEVDKFGKVQEPGTPTPIRLLITRVDRASENKKYQKEIDPTLTSWGGDNFKKNIDHCDLPPGIYRVRLENLRQSPEFFSIPTFFTIGMDSFKVTFDPKKSDRSKTCLQ